jgi:hypothetical protein
MAYNYGKSSLLDERFREDTAEIIADYNQGKRSKENMEELLSLIATYESMLGDYEARIQDSMRDE